MRREHLGEPLAEALANLLAQLVQLAHRLAQRALQRAPLGGAGAGGPVVDRAELERRRQEVHRPARDARRGGDAAQHGSGLGRLVRRGAAPAGPARAQRPVQQPRRQHDRAHLRRDHLQELELRRREHPHARGARGEHAHRLVAHEQRHRHERAEALLARVREGVDARVLAHVGHGDGAALGQRPAGDPLPDANAHAPDRLRVQAARRAQHQPLAVVLEQVDRAGGRVHPARDQAHHVLERLLEVMAAGEQPPEVAQEVRGRAGHGVESSDSLRPAEKEKHGRTRVVPCLGQQERP